MTPRPVHRWKSLWLGLFILIFLLWAWDRSRSHDATIGARLGKDTWHHLVSSGGYLNWYIESFPPGSRYSRSIDYNFATTRDTAPWFPPPFTHEKDTTAYVSRTIHGIAHWFIILLFLAPWFTIILWRARRRHRLTAPPDTPLPIPYWKTFWLGIFVLIALVIAWTHSMGRFEAISFTIHANRWQLSSSPGTIDLRQTPLDTSSGWFHEIETISLDSTDQPFLADMTAFPEGFRRWDNGPATHQNRERNWIIAHWLITLLFLIAWTTFLLFRSRRLRHLTAQSPQTQPTPSPDITPRP